MVFGDWGLRLPCFSGGGGGEADPCLEPVVLVSGIGGSILNARKKNSGFEFRVWVRVLFSNLEFKKNLWSTYNEDTGYVEPIDPNVEIVVPQDDHGLFAIDILDPSLLVKLLHVTDVYQFHDMIEMLVGCGYNKGTTLFGYAYDFRQSNRISKTMDDLKLKLETAYKASGGKKVNLISHSMGGLLLRCFLSLHPDWQKRHELLYITHQVFEKYVSKWICLACPFQGAPGCIHDSLLTGLQFIYGFESYLFINRWTMHQLLIVCPSIYEMLPNPEFHWKQQPVIEVWRKLPGDDEVVKLDVYDSTECFTLFEEALRNNEMEYNGKSISLPFNFKILEWAAGTRKVLNNAKLPSSVSFYNLYGTSFDTPHSVCYGSETSPIEDLTEVCHRLPTYTCVDGDGTVPAESAMADGFEAVARVGVRTTHRGLFHDETVFEYLREWLGVSEESKISRRTSKVMDELSSSPVPNMKSAKDLSRGKKLLKTKDVQP